MQKSPATAEPKVDLQELFGGILNPKKKVPVNVAIGLTSETAIPAPSVTSPDQLQAVQAQAAAHAALSGDAAASTASTSSAAPVEHKLRQLTDTDTQFLLRTVDQELDQAVLSAQSFCHELGLNPEQTESILEMVRRLNISSTKARQAQSDLDIQQQSTNAVKDRLSKAKAALAATRGGVVEASLSPVAQDATTFAYPQAVTLGEGPQGSISEGYTLPTPEERAAHVMEQVRAQQAQAQVQSPSQAQDTVAFDPNVGAGAVTVEEFSSTPQGQDGYDGPAGVELNRKKVDPKSRLNSSSQYERLEQIRTGAAGLKTQQLGQQTQDLMNKQRQVMADTIADINNVLPTAFDFLKTLPKAAANVNVNMFNNAAQNTQEAMNQLSPTVAGLQNINDSKAIAAAQQQQQAQAQAQSENNAGSAANELILESQTTTGYSLNDPRHLGAQAAASLSLADNEQAPLPEISAPQAQAQELASETNRATLETVPQDKSLFLEAVDNSARTSSSPASKVANNVLSAAAASLDGDDLASAAHADAVPSDVSQTDAGSADKEPTDEDHVGDQIVTVNEKHSESEAISLSLSADAHTAINLSPISLGVGSSGVRSDHAARALDSMVSSLRASEGYSGEADLADIMGTSSDFVSPDSFDSAADNINVSLEVENATTATTTTAAAAAAAVSADTATATVTESTGVATTKVDASVSAAAVQDDIAPWEGDDRFNQEGSALDHAAPLETQEDTSAAAVVIEEQIAPVATSNPDRCAVTLPNSPAAGEQGGVVTSASEFADTVVNLPQQSSDQGILKPNEPMRRVDGSVDNSAEKQKIAQAAQVFEQLGQLQRGALSDAQREQLQKQQENAAHSFLDSFESSLNKEQEIIKDHIPFAQWNPNVTKNFVQDLHDVGIHIDVSSAKHEKLSVVGNNGATSSSVSAPKIFSVPLNTKVGETIGWNDLASKISKDHEIKDSYHKAKAHGDEMVAQYLAQGIDYTKSLLDLPSQPDKVTAVAADTDAPAQAPVPMPEATPAPVQMAAHEVSVPATAPATAPASALAPVQMPSAEMVPPAVVPVPVPAPAPVAPVAAPAPAPAPAPVAEMSSDRPDYIAATDDFYSEGYADVGADFSMSDSDDDDDTSGGFGNVGIDIDAAFGGSSEVESEGEDPFATPKWGGYGSEAAPSPQLPAIAYDAHGMRIPGKVRVVTDDFLSEVEKTDDWYQLILKVFPEKTGIAFATLSNVERIIDSNDPYFWHLRVSQNDDVSETIPNFWDQQVRIPLEQYLGHPLRLDIVKDRETPKGSPQILARACELNAIEKARKHMRKVKGLEILLRNLNEDLSHLSIELYRDYHPEKTQLPHKK